MTKEEVEVVVVGSCIYDMISYAPRFPKAGESVRGTRFLATHGGKGANQAVQAALLGARAAIVTKLGTDYIGDSTMENFRKFNVNTDHVSRSQKTASGTGMVTVTDTGENCIVVTLGANMELTPAEILAAEQLIRCAKVVVCQLETPLDTIVASFQLARKHGVKTVWNAAPGIPNLPSADELLRLSDIVCVNENEAEFLAGCAIKDAQELHAAMRGLVERGASCVVVTLGARGCCYLAREMDAPVTIPASKAAPVDTLGAGDAFVGALAFYLVSFAPQQMPLDRMLRGACVVAGRSVEKPGSQTAYATRAQLPAEIFSGV